MEDDGGVEGLIRSPRRKPGQTPHQTSTSPLSSNPSPNSSNLSPNPSSNLGALQPGDGRVRVTVEQVKVEVRFDRDLVFRDARQLADWELLLANAERELATANRYYKTQRAQVVARILESEPKMTEARLRSRIEASSAYDTWQRAIAEATRNVRVIAIVVDALRAAAGRTSSSSRVGGEG